MESGYFVDHVGGSELSQLATVVGLHLPLHWEAGIAGSFLREPKFESPMNARNGNHSSWVPFLGGIFGFQVFILTQVLTSPRASQFIHSTCWRRGHLSLAITTLDVSSSVPISFFPQSGNLFILHHACGLGYRSHLGLEARLFRDFCPAKSPAVVRITSSSAGH